MINEKRIINNFLDMVKKFIIKGYDGFKIGDIIGCTNLLFSIVKKI